MKKVVSILYTRKPLSVEEFERLIGEMFTSGGPWNLWGNPIKLGPRKVHVYGAHREKRPQPMTENWCPVSLEMNQYGMMLLVSDAEISVALDLVRKVRSFVDAHARIWIDEKEV